MSQCFHILDDIKRVIIQIKYTIRAYPNDTAELQ